MFSNKSIFPYVKPNLYYSPKLCKSNEYQKKKKADKHF